MFDPPAPYRVLVIANENVTGNDLHKAVLAYPGETDILVVAPALNSRLRHWTSDEDRARVAAEGRLAMCLPSLRAAGMQAHGRVGDADPIQAIADALAVSPADELLVATHPERHSNWLAHDLVDRARACFALPVFHVVRSPPPRTGVFDSTHAPIGPVPGRLFSCPVQFDAHIMQPGRRLSEHPAPAQGLELSPPHHREGFRAR
jgi:hypothetical protein